MVLYGLISDMFLSLCLLLCLPCHSREGGNPDWCLDFMDSRLRGNDSVQFPQPNERITRTPKVTEELYLNSLKKPWELGKSLFLLRTFFL